MTNSSIALLLLFSCCAPISAYAQSVESERGYVTGAADFLVAGSSFSDVVHPIDFAEPATVGTNYHVGFAPGFEVGGGVRVWRRMFIGVDVSRVSGANDADVTAQVPHPLQFNTPRSVAGSASNLDRTELGVHVLVSWVTPLSRRWQLAVSGGPSWITVDQDLVGDVTVSQTYPFDTATFAGVVTQPVSNSHVGVNAGVNAHYLLKRRASLTFGARYSHAHVPLSASASTDAGGLHVTAGLRLGF